MCFNKLLLQSFVSMPFLKREVENLTVCYHYVTYMLQSEFTLYSYLSVKELLAWNKRNSWSWFWYPKWYEVDMKLISEPISPVAVGLFSLNKSVIALRKVIRKIFSTSYSNEFYHVASCFLKDGITIS